MEHLKASLGEPMDDVGSRVGRFRLLGRLGQGGMGRLYLAAYDGVAGTSKVVALKCVLPELASRTEFKRMFLDEARVAIQLAHPSIVTTHELGEADGMYFISMEYVPGEDLAHILKRCRRIEETIPLRVALQIAISCASALEYAHTLTDSNGRPLRVVHCDVNPTNVMVSYHGAVKLLDFGIARFRTSSVGAERGPFRGKVAYSALEQLDGGTLDARTDVFCLGIILWEMLAGRRLFDAPNPLAAIEALRSRPVAPPSLFRPEVPADLDAIVLDALQRDPNRRPQSAAELGRRLDRVRSALGGGVSESSLAGWLAGLFGRDRAIEKLRAAQRDAQRAPDEENTAEEFEPEAPAPAAEAAPPRVAWSTDAGGGSAVHRSLPELSIPNASGMSNTGSLSRGVHRNDERHFVTSSVDRSTMSGVSEPPPEPARWPSPIMMGAAFVLAAGIGASAWWWMPNGATVPGVERRAEPPVIVVTSQPPGGRVFVDGEPTGMVTPARLTGVTPGTRLRLRIDFPSGASIARRLKVHASGEQRIEVSANAVRGGGRTP